METLLHTTATYPNPKQFHGRGLSWYRNTSFNFPNGYCSAELFTSRKLSFGLRRYVTVGAKRKNNKKEDTHSFVPKPDEATGPFPEAVLLKEKKVQEDGKLLPEFADVEEQKLYEFLNLELESQLKVERMRHYEVVYLIHEKHAEEVGSVNEKVQEYLEAEFFLYGSMGHGLDRFAPNLTQQGATPIGGRKANLDPFTKDVIKQFAWQEGTLEVW
ncbi:hypothetical protein GH714_007692 [Hevea brasiliensis]|uniref:Uncharacterized protein n=1 Tax=Hevea brasiliensis TaxID=3981 RepID=A0A6A6M9E1_HEVBR|nr:hypothetical protein GH714_007692 [Hevea brasiliensis]